jgi:hypothetical protein
MKKITVLSLIAFCITLTAAAQEKEKIEPSGNIITKTVDVTSFDALKADGIYEMILTQGDKESVRIEADDNMQYLFSVKNEGNKLVISMPKLEDQEINISDDHKHKSLRWKVYVNFKSLKSLDLSVIGNVRGETSMKSDAFEVKKQGDR